MKDEQKRALPSMSNKINHTNKSTKNRDYKQKDKRGRNQTYSVPLSLRIRNCSGERTARHSSSDLFTDDPDAAIATTPLLKLLLLWWRANPRNPIDESLLHELCLATEVRKERAGRNLEREMGLTMRALVETANGVILRIREPISD